MKPTLKFLLNRIEAWAESHAMITDFGHGSFPDFPQGDKRSHWVKLYIIVQNPTINRTGIDFSFDFIVFTPTRENPESKEIDMESVKQAQSDMLQIVQDFVAEVQNGDSFFYLGQDQVFSIVGGVSALPFIEDQKDVLTGFNAPITLSVVDPLDACKIPYLTEFTPTPDQDCPDLKTVVNTAQEILIDQTAGDTEFYTIKNVDILDGAGVGEVNDELTGPTLIMSLTGMSKSFKSGKDHIQTDGELTIEDEVEGVSIGERLKISAIPRFGQNWGIKLIPEGFNILNDNGANIFSVQQSQFVFDYTPEGHITLVIRVQLPSQKVPDATITSGPETNKVIDSNDADALIMNLTGPDLPISSGVPRPTRDENTVILKNFATPSFLIGNLLNIKAFMQFGENIEVWIEAPTLIVKNSLGDPFLNWSIADFSYSPTPQGVNELQISVIPNEGEKIFPNTKIRDTTGAPSEVEIPSGSTEVLADIQIRHSNDTPLTSAVRLIDKLFFPKVNLKIGGADNIFESDDFTITGTPVATMTRDIDDLVGGGVKQGIKYQDWAVYVTRPSYFDGDIRWQIDQGLFNRIAEPTNPTHEARLADPTNPYVLENNNEFGNINRWTDSTGGQSYAEFDWSKDHLLGLEFQCRGVATGARLTFADARDLCIGAADQSFVFPMFLFLRMHAGYWHYRWTQQNPAINAIFGPGNMTFLSTDPNQNTAGATPTNFYMPSSSNYQQSYYVTSQAFTSITKRPWIRARRFNTLT